MDSQTENYEPYESTMFIWVIVIINTIYHSVSASGQGPTLCLPSQLIQQVGRSPSGNFLCRFHCSGGRRIAADGK